ncbi:diacylglycerol O-acyltransferase 2-like [Bufo gargarizans]|uniref:diacylglycerol O-acyltransferase 2-like n=1 Tax=Bufo gargarizans TaxID=30331 RepID=UPI001CF55D4C|nr:diacylglycerol O-acyltransferase 2-like [Bufo gargarizans]
MKTLNTPNSGLRQGTGSSLLSTVQDLPSVPRPSRSRVERQLQIISVLQWVMTVFIVGVACTAMLLYLFCTDWWLIAALYLAWLVFDWKTPSKGGRRSTWFRNWTAWRYFRDYFPIRLVKTHNLLPSCNYIFGYHPHGVMALGFFCNFGTEATGVSKKFPGIKPYPTTLAGNFRMPVVREYLMSAGHCSVSRQSIDDILSKNGTGNAVVIVIGGTAECLECKPGKNYVTLKHRKGFVKIALQHGANLVPVYSFGENKAYKQILFEEDSWGLWLQRKFQKRIGFAPCLFYGCGFFSADSWGFVPYPTPITTVVGEPIAVPKIEQPTQKDVDLYHGMYLTSLQKLFDKYKTEFGLSESDVLEII